MTPAVRGAYDPRMMTERELARIDADYDADMAAIERGYVAACEAAGNRRRQEIAEATRTRAEKLVEARREARVFV